MAAAGVKQISKPLFERYIGIDYSGARTPESGLKGLRVYSATGDSMPVEIRPPSGSGKNWTRKGVALWLVDSLMENIPSMVGIDHSFSFPLEYYEMHHLEPDWAAFLDDFQKHWPTNGVNVRVEFVRRGLIGDGAARSGSSRWRRITEKRAGAKSVFHFDVPGTVAKSTHAGLPWLRYMRQALRKQVHFWPFDGWSIPGKRSAVFEVYPSMWSGDYSREGRTPDQHDAFAAAAWMRQMDLNGSLNRYLKPGMLSHEKKAAEIEGWILGVV